MPSILLGVGTKTRQSSTFVGIHFQRRRVPGNHDYGKGAALVREGFNGVKQNRFLITSSARSGFALGGRDRRVLRGFETHPPGAFVPGNRGIVGEARRGEEAGALGCTRPGRQAAE